MQVDNHTSVGFANNTIWQKWSKAIDMGFYWIRNCTHQFHFKIYWGPGSNNPREYHTKHHSPGHHQLMRHNFLHVNPHVHLANLVVMNILQGCVNFRRMRELRVGPGINARRHIAAGNPL